MLTALVSLAPAAHATPVAHLHVTFAPYKLGKSTNVDFRLHIYEASGRLPPALTALAIRYPRNLGLDISGLGIKACARRRLEAFGAAGCTAESRMGEGSAVAEFEVESELLEETANVAIFRAPESEGHIAMLFSVNSYTPVLTELVLPGLLLEAPPPFEQISIKVPIIPTFPYGTDVAITHLNARFGPQGLTYYEHAHGTRIPYKPEGILLPHHCPTKGFQFSARVTFAEGTVITGNDSIVCPRGIVGMQRKR